jgi:hypothetical protein
LLPARTASRTGGSDIDTWAWLAVSAALVAGAVIASILLHRRRQHVWARLAQRHRLRVHRDGRGLRVEGKIDGRAFSLAQVDRGSDAGELGVVRTRMTIEVSSWPPGAVLESPFAAAPGALDHRPDELATGDEAFDQAVILRSPESAAIREYLTPARRRALLELVDSRPVSVANGAIAITERTMITELDRLEQHLEALRRAAQALDGQ